ncbi:MAG: hypothetical protein ACJ72N_07030 [Labedaea sp.]
MTDLALPPTAAPGRVGQATAIEQSRAVAQVQAAVLVARQYPRIQQGAVRAMQEACAQTGLAERAFYGYKRAGSQIKGSTVYLLRELARIWGNLEHGVAELRRDDDHGQSEAQAWAWDLETNTRVSTIFIVPHTRDADGATKKLTQSRDIYEAIANAGARRVRECIRAVLPSWLVEDAEARCKQTVENPRDENNKVIPLAKRIAAVVAAFEEMGVDLPRAEARVGRPSNSWTAWDVAQLTVTGGAIKRGDTTVAEAFPQIRITPGEIHAAADAGAVPADPPTADAPPAEPEEGAAAQAERAPAALLNKIKLELGELEVTTAQTRGVLQTLVGRPLRTSADITTQEAAAVADRLRAVRGSDNPVNALDVLLDALREAEQHGAGNA